MAFITTADITAKLPTGFDTNQVDRLLLSAEAELKRIGLVFTDEAASAFTIQNSTLVTRSVFNITPTRSISLVTIKTNGGNSTLTLTSNSDYVTTSHVNISGYTTQIKLVNYEIYPDQYLEVTGKRGIFVDFTTNNYEANLLTACLIDWIISQLNQKKGEALSDKNVQSARTGESQVSYFSRRREDFSRSFINDPAFAQAYNWFLGV